jgi:hypothetical protein
MHHYSIFKIFIIVQVNYNNANKACCGMGMSLAIFEKKAEQTCITDYTKSIVNFTHIDCFYFENLLLKIDQLKMDAVYFLGATDNSCFKKFLWCSGQEVTKADYKWINGQPNYLLGDQHCIAHVVLRGNFGIGVDDGLNDWECHENKLYLCE